jgi:hypothetical protein
MNRDQGDHPSVDHGKGAPEQMPGKYREWIVGSALIALLGVGVLFF